MDGGRHQHHGRARGSGKEEPRARAGVGNGPFRTRGYGGASGQTQRTIAKLKQRIAESERCIAAHERQTKRPVATDLQSLARVSWSSWNGLGRQPTLTKRLNARIGRSA